MATFLALPGRHRTGPSEASHRVAVSVGCAWQTPGGVGPEDDGVTPTMGRPVHPTPWINQIAPSHRKEQGCSLHPSPCPPKKKTSGQPLDRPSCLCHGTAQEPSTLREEEIRTSFALFVAKSRCSLNLGFRPQPTSHTATRGRQKTRTCSQPQASCLACLIVSHDG